MEALVGSLATPAAAVAGAYLLRRIGAFTALDGQTAMKYMNWLTLPSLILQSFNGVPLQPVMLPVLGAAVLVTGTAAATAWLLCKGQHPKERGLLSGSAVGGSLAAVAYPMAGAFFGQEGLRLALLWGLVNNIAVWVGSFLLFASAGAAFPEQYEHTDGGTYRGEWKGMLKEGFGVYTYASGARYEGEWGDNLKEGRGVYHFPKGGVYEGEWRGGKMAGVGVRTFASGKVQAGVWSEGRLDVPMEERQCALAVEAANEAAAVARRVQVGAGTPQNAAAQLLTDPSTWAYAACVLLSVAQRALPPTVDAVTRQLATAHTPLALLALGLSLNLQPPMARQMAPVAGVLVVRLLPPLAFAAAAAVVLGGPLGWAAARVLALVGPLLLCALAPLPPQAQGFAFRFRLNENLEAALSRSSTLASLLLMPAIGAAAVASALTSSLQPFYVALGAATALVAAGAAVGLSKGANQASPAQRAGRPGKVRMVYAGPPGSEGSGTAAAAAVAAVGGDARAGPQEAALSATPAMAAEAAAPPAPSSVPDAAAAAQQQAQQAKRRGASFQDVQPSEGPADGGSPSAGSSTAPQATGAVRRAALAWRPPPQRGQQRQRLGGCSPQHRLQPLSARLALY